MPKADSDKVRSGISVSPKGPPKEGRTMSGKCTPPPFSSFASPILVQLIRISTGRADTVCAAVATFWLPRIHPFVLACMTTSS